MKQTLKKTGILCLCLLVCSSGLLGASQGDGQTITTGSLFEEMVDMMSATRSYQANVTSIKMAKRMAMKALEIGR